MPLPFPTCSVTMDLDAVASLAVVPLIVGPLQALLALLPILLLALFSAIVTLFKPRTVWLMLRLAWRQKLALAGLAAIGGGTYAAIGQAGLFRTGANAVEAWEQDAAYPGFRGGPHRRGYVPLGDDPTAMSLNWRYLPPGSPSIFSSPAVVGDYLFFTTAKVTAFDAQGVGQLLCVNAHSGELVWRGQDSDRRATFSSPVIVGDYLAVGEGLHQTRDARLTVYDSRTGAVRWTYRTASHMESTPVIANGRVFVGAGRDGYYAFALEPDEHGRPRMLWHAPGERYMDASGSPAAHGDRVYVTMGRWGGQAVASLDAATGNEHWRVETPYPVFAGPTVVAERDLLLVGMGNGNFVLTAEQAMPGQLQWLAERGASEEELERARVSLGPAGAVWAIDLNTGEVRWRFDTGRIVLGQIAAGDDRLFFGGRDGFVYAVDYAGREIARFNTRSPIVASPALAGGHVYVVTIHGMFYCLDARTLQPVWQRQLGEAAASQAAVHFSSPTVAHGQVYIGTPDDGLVAIGQPADPEPLTWTSSHGNAGGGRADDAALPAHPDMRAATARDGVGPVTAPLAVQQDAILTPIMLDGRPGVAAWRRHADTLDEPLWFAAAVRPIRRSPVADERSAFFATGEPGEANRHVRAIDIASGEGRWSRPLAATATGHLLLADGLVLIADDELVAVDPATGESVWSFDTEPMAGVAAARHSRIAVAGGSHLHLLDARTGRALWSNPLPARAASGPVFCGTNLVVPTAGAILAVDEVSAVVTWRAPLDAEVAGPLIVTGGHILARTVDDELLVLDPRSGRVLHTIAGVDLHPLVDDQSVYVRGSRGFQRYSLTDGRRSNWMRVDETWGELLVPPVAAAGRVYLGTASGLVVLGEGD